MRQKKKLEPLFECVNPLIVEPNNSLSPRQILLQYGQGVSFSGHVPSDEIDDVSFSDDDMVDKVIEFEDEFEAREFLNQPMYPINDAKNDSVKAIEPKQDSQLSVEFGSDETPRDQ